MARKARIHVPGIIQHIMSRGIDGKSIFADDEERTTFLHIFAESLSIMKKNAEKLRAELLLRRHWFLRKVAENICGKHESDRETFKQKNSQCAERNNHILTVS